jgi:AICAR transformylase/IMP cyclohydrolase PurH
MSPKYLNKQAEEIAQLILRKREKSKNMHQESLVKNKEHYNKIMEKLNKSHFEDDFKIKEQQYEHRIKYEERIKNLQKNQKYQKRVKEYKNNQKEEVIYFLNFKFLDFKAEEGRKGEEHPSDNAVYRETFQKT